MKSPKKLKEKLKSHPEVIPESSSIRLHRAISWYKAAKAQETDPDISFITYWIAFNACYGTTEINPLEKKERDRFAHFTNQLSAIDKQDMLYNILWDKFSGPIRILIDNKFAFKPFWEAQKGKEIDWEKAFLNEKQKAFKLLNGRNVSELLQIVIQRLYVVRNQLVHGGATYKSSVNRAQVKDAQRILSYLIPAIIELMIENSDLNWGDISYPVIEE